MDKRSGRMNYDNLIEDYRDEMIKTIQESVRIKSVEEEGKEGMPFGEGPFKALEHILSLAGDMGFETKNMEGYAGWIEFGQGEETVAVLGHIDVVPEGDGWDFNPYGGEIHNGKMYGRGVLDDKGPTIAALYGMKALKDSGVKLNRKIRLIIGANEETDWRCMDYYFKHEPAPDLGFTPDANFPVIYGEKGIIDFDLYQEIEEKEYKGVELLELSGGNAANMVADNGRAVLRARDMEVVQEAFRKYKEENDQDLSLAIDGGLARVTARGVSAHGSTPQIGKSAIDYIMTFLAYVFNGETDLSEFISFYNERIAFEFYGEKIGCGLSDDISGKLSFNPGVLKYEDGRIIITVNVRYPIKSSSEEVYSGIEENIRDTNVQLLKREGENKPLYVEKDNFLVKKLMEVYQEETGDMDAEPITIGGGTYARATKNVVAFGPDFPGQASVAHQKNEFIGIDHLEKLLRIYTKALYELAK